jgi:hypothetical protein
MIGCGIYDSKNIYNNFVCATDCAITLLEDKKIKKNFLPAVSGTQGMRILCHNNC